MSEGGTSIAALLDRLTLLAMLAALAAILTAAMVMQYALGEIPCPLCLLQRVAMFGCCFGLIRQLHAGGSERGTGIALIFAVLLLVISVRQTLLDIYPRPGHDYVGSAVFGLHLPVWSVVIAVALLLGLAARLTLFGGSHSATNDESARSTFSPSPRNAASASATRPATGCSSNGASRTTTRHQRSGSSAR